jgi:hypothetical protein
MEESSVHGRMAGADKSVGAAGTIMRLKRIFMWQLSEPFEGRKPPHETY